MTRPGLAYFLPQMKSALIVLCAALATSACGADAVFTPDGKTVHACPRSGAKLWSISTTDGKATVVDLEKELGAGEELQAITGGPKGAYWIATRKSVWLWNADGKLEKRTTIEGDSIEDLAYNPVSDTLFISGRLGENDSVDSFKALRPGEKEPAEVKLSLDPVIVPAFDREGRFHFRHNDDLWVGAEVSDADDVEMSAYRAVPLGHVFSEVGELRASKIISAIVPVEKSLYIALSSKVEAALIKLPKPSIGKGLEPLAGQPEELKGIWKRMAGALATVQEIPLPGEISSISGLCASPDGARVFFWTQAGESGDTKFHLLDVKTGKIRVMGEVPK